MPDHDLEGLDRSERFAAVAVARAVGATPAAYDTAGRQGAFDVLLTYPDGRCAALEITTHAAEGVRQRDALLSAEGWRWPNPGAWAWTLTVQSPRDVPRLRQVYVHAIEVCEAHGAVRPEALPVDVLFADSDLCWLAHESTACLAGMPSLPARDGSRVRPVWVTPAGDGGVIDTGFEGLVGALAELLSVPTVARRVAKVAGACADERHLFVGIGEGGVPFSQYSALMTPETLPPEPPPLPEGLTHLWLSTGYERELLGWTPAGWGSFDVYY